MNTPLRIVLADDHQLFTEGLCALFQNDSSIDVCAVYNDGRLLLDQIENDRADVLLLDVKMRQPDGLTVLNELQKRDISIKVIMLSTYSDVQTMMESKSRGAHGYLLKNTSRSELLDAMNRVMEGELVFRQLDSSLQNEQEKFLHFQSAYKITRREWEIMLLIKQQNTNQQISEKLFLSIYTIETHRKNLMQKLGLKTAIQLYQFLEMHQI